jgi:hypothetical protein
MTTLSLHRYIAANDSSDEQWNAREALCRLSRLAQSQPLVPDYA